MDNLAMKPAGILIVTKEQTSSWKSCQHITKNLVESYKIAFSGYPLQFLKIAEHVSSIEAIHIAKKIKEANPEFLIWADHKPCCADILMALKNEYAENPPSLFVHLFGDFVLDCVKWERCLPALQHFHITFFTASSAQKKLVEKMFTSEKLKIDVIPFPADSSFFNMNGREEARTAIRERFNLKNETVLLYTGRVSLQKNIDSLINTFNKARDIAGEETELWIAGPWDDILLPYFGVRGLPGSHYTHFKNSTSSQKNIRFLGDLDEKQLKDVYMAADCFVSLSTFNDEDYGMSVAEAMLCGLPSVITEWGGFASFAEYSESVSLIPVEFKENRYYPNQLQAQKKMIAGIFNSQNQKIDHKKVRLDGCHEFSIEAVAKKLKAAVVAGSASSIEFTSLFYKTCAAFKLTPEAPFKNNLELYRKIYDGYGSCQNEQ